MNEAEPAVGPRIFTLDEQYALRDIWYAAENVRDDRAHDKGHLESSLDGLEEALRKIRTRPDYNQERSPE